MWHRKASLPVSVSESASPPLVPAAGRRRVRFFSLLSRREIQHGFSNTLHQGPGSERIGTEGLSLCYP